MKKLLILSLIMIAALGDVSSEEGRPTSCEEVKETKKESGIYKLYVRDKIIEVYCEQITDNGGWIVIQRRTNAAVDFYRSWQDYERGFGDLRAGFWLGLENIHALTKDKNSRLRIELVDCDSSYAYAVYNTFRISDANDGYRLYIGGYEGTAGDSLSAHNNQKFSTFDRDNDSWQDGSCAVTSHGAWWYNFCHTSNLNGRYKPDGSKGDDGVVWFSWNQDKRSHEYIEMKIKYN